VSILISGFIFRIIFTGVGFFASLLIAKLAGTSQFGVLSLIIVNAALIHIITGLGTDAAIVWHGATGKEFTRNKMFTFTIGSAGIQFILFFLPAIGVFLITGKTLLGRESSLVIFYSELIYFTGLVLIDKFSSLFYSLQDARQCNKILAIVSLVMLCCILFLWITRSEFISDYPVLIYSLFVFIPSVFVSLSFIKKFKPGFQKISKSELNSFLSFSILVFATNIIQFVAFRADYWFISWYYDFAELGIYAQASKFAQLLWIVPGILAGLIIPALKNEKQPLTNTSFLSICRLNFFLHLCISILLLGVSYGIYRLFLPEAYNDGFQALLIMLPGYLLFIYATMLASFYSAKRLLQINFYGSLLCFVLMIAFDFILIPVYGYYGAAFANLIAYSFTAFYFIIKSRRIVKAGISEYFMVSKADFKLFSLTKSEIGNNV
jgi:O-antigen/teichoic acid export membrane protein